ncbi:hypothetical protein DRN93_02075 [archaeon]|nr:MAG: hypothetical protein DRN93_02075 [archaeon]
MSEVSWFKELFDREPKPPKFPFLRLEKGEERVIEILDAEPQIVTMKGKKVGILHVRNGARIYRLRINSISLGQRLYDLQMIHGSLKGLKVKIRKPTGEGEDRYWRVEEVE